MMDSRTFRPHGAGGPEKEALRGSCEHLFRRNGLKLAFPGTSATYLTSIGRSSPSRCLSALTLQVQQWHRSFCKNEGRTRLEGSVRTEAAGQDYAGAKGRTLVRSATWLPASGQACDRRSVEAASSLVQPP